MNNMSFKYKSVAQIALKDIAEHQRELLKEKHSFLKKEYLITSKQLLTKETRRLNRKLRLHSINYGNKQTI